VLRPQLVLSAQSSADRLIIENHIFQERHPKCPKPP
jgi:hypothetical protein